jgi:hypothetical protein
VSLGYTCILILYLCMITNEYSYKPLYVTSPYLSFLQSVSPMHCQSDLFEYSHCVQLHMQRYFSVQVSRRTAQWIVFIHCKKLELSASDSLIHCRAGAKGNARKWGKHSARSSKRFLYISKTLSPNPQDSAVSLE